MQKINYVPEIDGLRSLAVIPVVLYHLGFTWIPGGFLGVDVFFVISGYLITAILIKDKSDKKRFYFYDFYLRRLRRIFPTFFSVIIATIVASYFLLLPEDFIELGRSALAGVSFFSNVYFYLNTGYFDAPAELMPLLHTWSLAVEEQFYLIWPALILVVRTLSKKATILLIFFIFSISFLLSIVVTPINPSLAFYNFPFRIFQFLLGAAIPLCISKKVLYQYGSRFASTSLQLAGFSLIVFSVLYFSNEDGFPGWLAIVPSLGASLFIVGATLPHRLAINPMTSKLFVGIGKISFSLYLWHWPVITLYKVYLGGSKLDAFEAVWLLALTLLLSLASFQLIEKPFRQQHWERRAVAFSLGSAICVVCAFVLLFNTSGFSNRIPDAEEFASPKKMWEWNCPSKVKLGNKGMEFCTFGVPWEEASNKIVLWGDSHAQQLAPLLELVANEHQLSFLLFPSCCPVTDGKEILIRHPNPARSTDGCFEAKQRAYELLRNDDKISLAILAGAWQYSPKQMYTAKNDHPEFVEGVALMKKGLKNTALEINDLGVDVLLLGDTPAAGSYRTECAGQNTLLRKSKPNCSPIPLKEVMDNQGATEKIVMEIASEVENVEFHSIISNFCGTSECPIFINDEYIYRDGDHIRRNISYEIKKSLVDLFGLNEMTNLDIYNN